MADDGRRIPSCCAVEESGRAIAREHFGSLFESFSTTKENGVCMGLSIGRSIIKGHGGRSQPTTNLSLTVPASSSPCRWPTPFIELSQIEPVEVHDLYPGGDKIVDELLLSALACIDFAQGA